MNIYFETYNNYLNFLFKVECSNQNLDYGDTLKQIVSNRADSGEKEEPLTVPESEPIRQPEPPTPDFDLEFEDGYYIGETQKGLMHGFGIRYWDNGKKWEGSWLNGEANGHITVSFDGVVTYDGNMVNGLPNGKGTYIDPDNGRTYIGNWVDFKREGEGKLLTGEGEKIYEGEWLNDKYHGYGQSFLRGICRYEGGWENGQRHGGGISYDEDGGIEYEGLWENNERADIN